SSHSSAPRGLAFELIIAAEPDREAELLDQMLDDPANDLRFMAVEDLLARAKSAKENEVKKELYREAIEFTRDVEQMKAASDGLKKLGAEINLVDHLGLITRWHVIGPFDNSGGKGFNQVYPPEVEIDLSKSYEGKEGSVEWQELATDDAL